MRLAYLVSQYPAITHTFILREIRALRTQGFEIETVSIRAADRPAGAMSEEEQDELKRTWAVLPQGYVHIALAQLQTFARRPAAYLATLWSAITIARLDLPATISNLFYFAEAVTAGRYLERRGFTHVHTHFASTVAMWIPKLFPITYSSTIHGSDEFIDVAGFFMWQKTAAARFVCTISQYGRSQVMRASDPDDWDKVEVSPLGVDPGLFTPRPHRDVTETFEIVSVGRLAPPKAQVLMIDAIAELVRRNRRVRLRIAGEGPERPRLEKAIARHQLQDQAILLGARTQTQVRELYQQADVFLLTSFAEGMPVVLMEAMAMEVPCVSTWITGIPEMIQHGETGWLIPPADSHAVADAIEHLMDHPELRFTMGQAGRVQVEQNFDLAKNVGRLAEIYRRRLDNTRS